MYLIRVISWPDMFKAYNPLDHYKLSLISCIVVVVVMAVTQQVARE